MRAPDIIALGKEVIANGGDVAGLVNLYEYALQEAMSKEYKVSWEAVFKDLYLFSITQHRPDVTAWLRKMHDENFGPVEKAALSPVFKYAKYMRPRPSKPSQTRH